MSKIVFINNSSELGAGTRGSSLGYPALKIAAIKNGSPFFKDTDTLTIVHENELLEHEISASNAKRIEGIYSIHEKVSSAVSASLEAQKFPFVIAGDHSNAAGTIAGIKKKFPDKRLGVIWIDAHADLHSPYTTPSGNIHGMPLAIALGEDNKSNARNILSDKEMQDWNKLKSVSGQSPCIGYEDLVFIGLRDTEYEEDWLIENNNVFNLSVTDVRLKGSKSIRKEIEHHLNNTDLIYISFDVDSMDCLAISHGTGTPVPGGFTKQESIKLLAELIQMDKLCCFEVTEINPLLDEKGNKMAESSLEIMEVVKNGIEQSN